MQQQKQQQQVLQRRVIYSAQTFDANNNTIQTIKTSTLQTIKTNNTSPRAITSDDDKTKMPVIERHSPNNRRGATTSSSSGSDVSGNEKENRHRHSHHHSHHDDKHRYGHHHSQVDHIQRVPHHSFFPGFADEFFHHSPFNKDFDEWMPVLRNLDRGEDHTIHHSSPGYEINETENDYQIAIDVPGVHLSDLQLQLENYGHILHVMGKREIHREGKLCEAKFEKRFRIGHNIDHDSISAHLSEGVLVVTAPKLREIKKKPHRINIHEVPGEVTTPTRRVISDTDTTMTVCSGMDFRKNVCATGMLP